MTREKTQWTEAGRFGPAPRRAATPRATTRPAVASGSSASNRRFALWAALLAASQVYDSLAVGPLGFHYVPLDFDRAWQIFLNTPYLANGADQRPDWVANLMATIPLGFLLTGAFSPGRGTIARWLAALPAVLVGIAFILAVKFAQLWFPPRTVSLNYILAQSLGCLFGVGLFVALKSHVSEAAARIFGDHGARGLTVLLAGYAAALILFMLLPLDIVLDGDGFRDRMAEVPRLLVSLPGADRGEAMRLAIVLVETAAMVPVGMLLALLRPSWRLSRIAVAGLVINAGLTFVSIFISSAAPTLVAIVYRTAGVAAGGWLSKQLAGRDLVLWRWRLSRFVPAAAAIYVVLVLFVSGVLNLRRVPLADALAILDPRGLLPFWHYYIVSKAHAALSLVVHAATYAPIGAMIWIRRGTAPGNTLAAACLALPLSALMELARWLKQGMQPDFSDPIIAAVAAGIAVHVMPIVWRALDIEARALAGLSGPAAAPRFVAGGLPEARP